MNKNTSKIKSEDDLKSVLDGVQKDLIYSNYYYKLYKDIDNSVPTYSKEMNQSRVFWSLTRDALYESALIGLCRAYERDSDRNANSLGFLLTAIKANLEMFEFEPFKERMKENVHSDPNESWQALDIEELDDDIEFVAETNPSLKKLIYWRDKQFVHRDAAHVIRKITIEQDLLLTQYDFEHLLNGGIAITNRYSRLFYQTTWSSTMIGQDDYKSVLSLIRGGLELHKIKLDEEYRRAGLTVDYE